VGQLRLCTQLLCVATQSAGLGVMQLPNNSFKPKPLRGSANSGVSCVIELI
jgi:hypothetical protein